MQERDIFIEYATTQMKMASDPMRLKMLFEIEAGRRSIGEITDAVGVTRTSASNNLKLLKLTGLVEGARAGKHASFTLTGRGKKLAAAIRMMGSC